MKRDGLVNRTHAKKTAMEKLLMLKVLAHSGRSIRKGRHKTIEQAFADVRARVSGESR